MKKTVRVIAFVCIFVMLMTVTVFAQNSNPEIEIFETSFDDVPKFLSVGETPDMTSARVRFTFVDGTVKTVRLTNEMLPKDISFETVGLKTASIEIYGEKFDFSFIVYDPQLNFAFTDVSAKYWGYRDIKRCAMASFMNGVEPTIFNANGNMTRAQFAQMLYNIYKEDKTVFADGKPTVFTDVNKNAWYYEAVTACSAAGIVDGVGKGLFKPNNPITRQDASLMMMRIILGDEKLDAVDIEATVAAARENGIAAVDFDDTSNYAKSAMAASLGIIFNGNDIGKINPKNNIRRVECATIVSNYLFKDFIDPEDETDDVKHLVYLSPSRQMENKYTGVNTTEGIQMYIVAEYAKTKLEELGYDVFVADVNTSIYGPRAEEAKQMGADCYVAIHSNAAGGPNNGSISGTRCFYNGQNEGAQELSQAILDEIKKITINHNGYIKEDYLCLLPDGKPFAEVMYPEMANLILEVEFHDYAQYAQWIVDNVKAIGNAIAVGIDNYFKSLDA